MSSPALLLTIKITSDLREVARVRKALQQSLNALQIPTPLIQQAELAISEWITNLIKHSKIVPTEITLRVQSELEKLLLIITDNGSHFTDYEQKVSENAQMKDDLPESGMGIYLIQQYFPLSQYRQVTSNDLNEFMISIPVAQKQPHIAIVEDDHALRLLMNEYLKEEYQIATYPDARSLLASISEMTPDLVISDISMPDMDGLTLRRELAARTDTALIPFVFLTSHEDETSEDLANQLGIDDYLKKPVSKSQLRSVIKRILQRNKTNTTLMGALFDEQVTAALRPSLPEKFLKFNAITLSRSAEAGGGDFIVSLPGIDQHHIILGDVMGHGLNAKFYAHLYAGYLQGALHQITVESGIAGCLGKVSDLIQQDPYLESVIVTCLGLTCYDNGDIVMANAAHPRPLLIHSQGLEFLEVNGALPGMNLSNHYETLRLSLGMQRLLIYSDGLFEVGKNAADMENAKQKMLASIAASYHLPLAEAANSILKQWETLSIAGAQDDVTVILLGAAM